MTAPVEATKLTTQPAARAVRVVALELVDAIEAAHQRLQHPKDTEALHDFRVALRRLRSWLRAYRSLVDDSVGAKDRKRLRKLADVTDESRDVQVHLAWVAEARTSLARRQRAGARWLTQRLTSRQREADGILHDEIDRHLGRAVQRLRAALAEYATPVQADHPASGQPTFGAATAPLVRRHAHDLERRLAAVQTQSDESEAHRARIAAKRLRYLLEPLTSELPEAAIAIDRLKVLQDDLGELHDVHTFGHELVDAIAEAAAGHARSASLELIENTSDSPSQRRRRPRDPGPGLLALTKRLSEAGDAAFARVRTAWLDGGASDFFALTTNLADELHTRGAESVEIERKYLLDALPAAAAHAPHESIEQGWLPGDRIAERLRRVRSTNGDRYYRTIKLGAGTARIEVEEEIDATLFDALWPLTASRRVHKVRHRVDDDGLVWEIDRFTDRDLVLAEVELASADTRPPLPDWMRDHVVREVTGEPEYVNLNLAR